MDVVWPRQGYRSTVHRHERNRRLAGQQNLEICKIVSGITQRKLSIVPGKANAHVPHALRVSCSGWYLDRHYFSSTCALGLAKP